MLASKVGARKFIAIFVFAIASLYRIRAQDATLSFSATGSFKLVERSDWSKYRDGAYLGHVYRESRARLEGSVEGKAIRFRGEYWVFEETLRDMALKARRVEAEARADFLVHPEGRTEPLLDEGFPSLRSLPSFSAKSVKLGDRWQAEGSRVVDPENTGRSTLIPFLAEYAYRGIASYGGRRVHSLAAKFATRYRLGQDRSGDPSLRSAAGSHEVDILIDAETGAPLFMRDRLDDTFEYSSGTKIRLKGSSLYFFAPLEFRDPAQAIADVAKAFASPSAAPEGASGKGGTATDGAAPVAKQAEASGSGTATDDGAGVPSGAGISDSATASGDDTEAGETDGAVAQADSGLSSSGPGRLISEETLALDLGNGITVENRSEGLLLTVNDLRFAADEARILPEESWRLDAIAQVLRRIPGKSFLVTGHTASLGRPVGEMELSVARAKRVLEELAARGVPENRMIYRGLGATKPVAPNDSEAGKAKNRRVEILVLDE